MSSNRKRKKMNWPRFAAVLGIFLAALFSGYSAMAYILTGQNPIDALTNPLAEATPQYAEGDRINLLLLGTDARPGEKDARTDSIIVASIDPFNKKAALVSIPRDSLVTMPNGHKDKINSANVVGGPKLTQQLVEQLMGIKIDNYVKTNFDGFKDIIDTLGGVTIDVEKNMRYDDPTDGTHINLKKGVQELDGKHALDYARFRHDALGDISRTARQQKMLKAVAKKMLEPLSVLKLPALVPQISKAVETDMGLSDMLKLATIGKNMENMQITSSTLPGQFYNNRGSYWKVNEEQAKLVLENLLNGQEMQTVAGPDINVASKKSTRTAHSGPKKKHTTKVTAPVKVDSTTPAGTDTGNGSGGQPADSQTGTEPSTSVEGVTNQSGSGEPSTTTDNGSGQTNDGNTSPSQSGAEGVGTGTTGSGTTGGSATETSAKGTGATGTTGTGTT